MPSLDDVLAAYKDCGISAAQAEILLTRQPPNGVGLPVQTARDYIGSTPRDCGTPIAPSRPAPTAVDPGVDMPDYNGFFGFLMLYMGMR
tara:strand:- start:2684 stop:2950 length:267 start_codon:yes stop_codon:yes gene_type:complete